MPFLAPLAGHGVNRADDLLPALGQIPECGAVLRQYGAGMHETQPGAAVDVGECPGNEEEQRAGRAGRMRAVPKRQGAHWDFPIVSPQADRGAAPFTSSL